MLREVYDMAAAYGDGMEVGRQYRREGGGGGGGLAECNHHMSNFFIVVNCGHF